MLETVPDVLLNLIGAGIIILTVRMVWLMNKNQKIWERQIKGWKNRAHRAEDDYVFISTYATELEDLLDEHGIEFERKRVRIKY